MALGDFGGFGPGAIDSVNRPRSYIQSIATQHAAAKTPGRAYEVRPAGANGHLLSPAALV